MFIDKKKPEKCVTVTVKFACDNIIAAAAEYGQRFSESDQSAYPDRQQSLVILITNYINYYSTGLSAEMMGTQNDGQNSGRQGRGLRSSIKL